MIWDDYYEKFLDWPESTQLKLISLLTEFTSTYEVIEVASTFDEQGATRLIRKALSDNLYFDANDIVELCPFVNTETTVDLIKLCKDKFTAEQVQAISESTILFVDDILQFINSDIPSLSEDEELDYEEPVVTRQKKPGLLTSLAMGMFGSHIIEKIFFDDDKN